MWLVTLLWKKTAAQYSLIPLMNSYSRASAIDVTIIRLFVIRSSWLEVLIGRETPEAELELPEPQPLMVGKKANLLRW